MSKVVRVALRSFAQLSEYQQHIVVLKSQGFRHQEISQRIDEEFGTTCSKNTINQYFAAGGALEQALDEYNTMSADEWLLEARTQAKLYSKKAINTLAELTEPNYAPMVRLNAARALANKYLPDGQQDIYVQQQNDDLPENVRLAMEARLQISSSS